MHLEQNSIIKKVKVSFLLLCESSSKPFQKHQRKTFQVTKIKTGRLHGDNQKKNNRDERSLHHVAMVAKFWMTTNRKSRIISNFTDLIQFHLIGKSWRNFLWDHIYSYLSLEKESDNFFIVFTYSIKWAHEIRKFQVVGVQQRQRNVQTSKIVVCYY